MQQTTINLPPTHPLRSMQGLAKQIALPGEYAPERFPSFPALERTAVMAFNQPASLTLNASVATKVAIARQAAWPVWANQDLNGQAYALTYSAAIPTGSSTAASYVVNSGPVTWSVGTSGGNTYMPATVGAAAPIHSYPILGVDNNSGPIPFIYVPNNCSMYVTVFSTVAFPAAATIRVNMELWNSPGEVSPLYRDVAVVLGNTGGATTAFSSVIGQWVRPVVIAESTVAAQALAGLFVSVLVTGGTATYTPNVGNPGSWSITGASSIGLYPLVAPVEFANSQIPWYSTRTTAAAMLGTNVTQVLNKAGTVLGGRVAPQVQSMWSVSQSYINSLHPAEKAWLPLETGVYTYCPPSTDLSDFWDYSLNTGNTVTLWAQPASCPVYRLDNTSLVNVMYLTAGSVAESLAVTCSWHIEFRTSSALFQIALSGLQLETFHQAQLALAAAGFFFENPTHKAVLGKVIDAVKKVAPPALKAMKVIYPGPVAALTGAYSAYKGLKKNKQASGGGKKKVPVPSMKPQMLPTSAQGSGIVANGKKKGKGKR